MPPASTTATTIVLIAAFVARLAPRFSSAMTMVGTLMWPDSRLMLEKRLYARKLSVIARWEPSATTGKGRVISARLMQGRQAAHVSILLVNFVLCLRCTYRLVRESLGS